MNLSFLHRFQFMPFLTASACTTGECDEGEESIFPVTAPTCVCTPAVGGINELYFISCFEVFSETNLQSLVWWARLKGTPGDPDADPIIPAVVGTLGRSGIGLGSIGKKGDKRDRLASCRPEQLTSVTWALKFVQKCFDKTSARTTCKKLNELITKFDKYLVVARMCDGDDTILPIGVFTTSDFNWIVPETSDDNQSVEFELSWKELGMPCTMDVAGLSTVLPKLS